MNEEEEFFEIDETENIIDNLEMVTYFLESSILYKWKWVIIALHQSLYGALISTLQGTDSRQTVIEKKGKRWKAMMHHIDSMPIDEIASTLGESEDQIIYWITNPNLISLRDALKNVKQKEYLPFYDNAKPLITTEDEDHAIDRLTAEFRGQFEHYMPKAWFVYVSIMPPIIRHVLRVINFLEFESNCVNNSEEQEKRIKSAIAKIQQALASSGT